MFSEKSKINGKLYTVQYFERAVFELHSENQLPYDVLLSLLGSISYTQKYPNGTPEQYPNTAPGSIYFPETGKRIGGKFLEYWKAHGGLMQQGYPISDEFQERNDADGKVCRVQYFERAVFELHPENKSPDDVLLSQLGSFWLRHKYPGGDPSSVTPTPTPDAWAELRQRSLKLPTLQPATSCPATPGKSISPDFGPDLGNGPVYPVGLGNEGVAIYDKQQIAVGGWFSVKVLWIGDPTYKSPALVRGHQIDGPGELGFERGSDPLRELRLHTNGGVAPRSGWHNWPSETRLRGPGCYAYQVDGAGFSEVIVFKVVAVP